MIKEEYGSIISDPKKIKIIEKILKHIDERREEMMEWDFKNDKPINNKLKKIELHKGNIRLVNIIIFRKQNPLSISIMTARPTFMLPQLPKKLSINFMYILIYTGWLYRQHAGRSLD